jgi:hypothetical protein
MTDLRYTLVERCPAEADSVLCEDVSAFVTGQLTLSFFNDMWHFVPAAERYTRQSRSS